MKLNTKNAFTRIVKLGKNENHLNISISRPPLTGRLQLKHNDYLKIYLDKTNNLVFEKLEV